TAMIRATALAIASRVIMSRGLRFLFMASSNTRPEAAALVTFSASVLAMVDDPSNDIPSASKDALMVLAVYMPPQDPLEGQAYRSMASNSTASIRSAV